MEKVCFITLGCKVNKYESDCMARILKDHGYAISHDLEPADIYIVNSCAVTNEGEKKSRQVISKIRAINPTAKIVYTGCASEHSLKQFEDKGIWGAIGTVNKENILEIVQNGGFIKYNHDGIYEKLSNPLTSQTRAYIKVQDGCNRFCSYCLIPYLRGRSRSRELSDIVEEASKIAQIAKEIVLVGIDISDYKIGEKQALGELIWALKDIKSRIRLGSFEANIISRDLLELLKVTKNFVPHFHLSLQSGDDSVLKAMNRKYTASEFFEKCSLIREYFPDANITTDIIVGFPTETEEMFENTCRFVKMVRFGKIHVFPYSKRAGTMASKLEDLPKSIKTERVNKLVEIGNQLQLEFNKENLGKICSVILEEEVGDYIEGFTDNYIKVYIKKTGKFKSGDVVKVKLVSLREMGIEGEIVC